MFERILKIKQTATSPHPLVSGDLFTYVACREWNTQIRNFSFHKWNEPRTWASHIPL